MRRAVAVRGATPVAVRGRGRARRAVAVACGASMDLGQALGERLRGETRMNLPPGRVGAFGVRETLEYLRDPNAFVATRVAKYGPVFKTGFFFKPAVVFGSRDAVSEFKSFESALPADEALPETFRELHTAYGALRQSGREHKATRANFSKVLGRAALASYAPVVAEDVRAFVEEKAKEKTMRAGDIKRFALELLFELFIGHVPDERYIQAMYAYNAGLLSLGKFSAEYKKGKQALEELLAYIEAHYRDIKASGALESDPKYFFLKQYSEAVDENGARFPDDRIATTAVLMVWGSYIEAAALMGHALVLLGDAKNAHALAEVRSEYKATNGGSGIRSLEDVTSAKYTEAVAKESLRVTPQTAGGLRVNPTNRKLAGYDIPAGYTLTADPRIPFKDEALFPDVDAFKPERFISGSVESQRNVVTGDTYFPGGMGQHQCPGISLAVVMTQIFLAEFSAAIDSWTPTSTPTYVQIPIVILADDCAFNLEPAAA